MWKNTRSYSAALSISCARPEWSEGVMEKPFDLSEKVALVTGGGRGIGAAIVTRFAEAGATVVVANRSRDIADELARRLVERGLRVHCVPFESLDRASLRDTVDHVAGKCGRLDIAVHNAGGCLWASL